MDREQWRGIIKVEWTGNREQWRGRERDADRGNDRQTIITEEWTGKPLEETQALAHNRSRWRRPGHSLSGLCADDSTAS